jgi:fluoroacetyl-CoA thioesterase
VGEAAMRVAEADTARSLRSGDLPVLASPRVAALAEEAAVAAIGEAPGKDSTTVGTQLVLEHLLPTAVGDDVVATATVTGVEGRRLRLTIEVVCRGEVVARAEHVRAVVQRDRFLAHPALSGEPGGD